jgi:hypothetical protein
MSSEVKAEERALHALESALGRFRKEAEETLTAVQQEVSQTERWLRGRHDYWQRERDQARRAVDQAREDLRRAEAALSACLAWRDDEGRGRSCSGEAAAVRAAEYELRQAEERLRAAEAELQNVKQWMAKVEQAVGEYSTYAGRLSDAVESRLPQAQVSVRSKRSHLRRYLRMQQGVMDLSRPAEWGKFAHEAVEQATEKAFPGRAESEVWVTKADGSRGRIDTLLGNLILEYKFSDLDAKRPAALRRALREVVSQLEGYRGSPDTPEAADLAVHFGSRPSDEAVRQYVEDYLGRRGISVLWGE